MAYSARILLFDRFICILQSLTVPRYHHIWGEIPSTLADKPKTEKVKEIESYHNLLERHYAAVSLKQHIEAINFVRNFKIKSENDADHQVPVDQTSLNEVPHLDEMLGSLAVDRGSFHAYFSNQLSENERFLLSSGAGREQNPKSSNNNNLNRLPSPAQLQEVATILGDSVTIIA